MKGVANAAPFFCKVGMPKVCSEPKLRGFDIAANVRFAFVDDVFELSS